MEDAKTKLQENYIELQNLDRQIKELQAHFQNLENKVLEFHLVKQGLDQLSNVKLETELLIPVCNGIFVKTALRENTEVIVNVGANVAVKKTILQAKDMMDIQVTEVKNVQKNILMELQKLSDQAIALETELNELVSTLNKQ